MSESKSLFAPNDSKALIKAKETAATARRVMESANVGADLILAKRNYDVAVRAMLKLRLPILEQRKQENLGDEHNYYLEQEIEYSLRRLERSS